MTESKDPRQQAEGPLNKGIRYCRFRRVKNSDRILDAWDYGYKAWPIGKRA